MKSTVVRREMWLNLESAGQVSSLQLACGYEMGLAILSVKVIKHSMKVEGKIRNSRDHEVGGVWAEVGGGDTMYRRE